MGPEQPVQQPAPDATTSGTPPADRYGEARRTGLLGSRVLAAGLVVLLLATLAAAGYWFYRQQTTPELSAVQTGFTVVDDHTLSLRVDVTRGEPGTPAVCIVRAKDSAGAEVGRREVYVPAGSERTVRLDTTLSTTGPAVGGDVYGCGTDIPAYLRP